MTTLRLAHAVDVPAVSSLWAEAMRTEPMAHWPLEPSASAFKAMFGTLATEYTATNSVWIDDLGQAAAAWLCPQVLPLFHDIDQMVLAAVTPYTDDHGARYQKFWDWVSGLMPDLPMWFLDVVAVRPSAQGRGLGGLLIGHGLALAATERVPAMSETGTPANVDYDGKFGFEVTHRAEHLTTGRPSGS